MSSHSLSLKLLEYGISVYLNLGAKIPNGFYKYEEIKERIHHLRKQQEASIEKPVNPQIASDKSKQVITNQLRERIRQLEAITENYVIKMKQYIAL